MTIILAVGPEGITVQTMSTFGAEKACYPLLDRSSCGRKRERGRERRRKRNRGRESERDRETER